MIRMFFKLIGMILTFIQRLVFLIIIITVLYLVLSLMYGGNMFRNMGDTANRFGMGAKTVFATLGDIGDQIEARRGLVSFLYDKAKETLGFSKGPDEKPDEKPNEIKEEKPEKKKEEKKEGYYKEGDKTGEPVGKNPKSAPPAKTGDLIDTVKDKASKTAEEVKKIKDSLLKKDGKDTSSGKPGSDYEPVYDDEAHTGRKGK